MKKNTFIMVTLAVFLFPFVFSCQTLFESDKEITFLLPQWPPEDCCKENYPSLSRWKLTVSSADKSFNFYVSSWQKSVQISTEQNKPVCVTATPVTFVENDDTNSTNSETLFFKPAGAIYPFSSSDSVLQLSWIEGFSAHIFELLVLNKSNIVSGNFETFLQSFNWKKLQEKIFCNSEKIEDQKFYNPWLLNEEKIFQNLTVKTFDSDLLKMKYVYSVPIEVCEFTPYANNLLSAYIPENKWIQENSCISLKKNEAQCFSINNKYSALVTASSAKKVSLELLYMPIFISEL